MTGPVVGAQEMPEEARTAECHTFPDGPAFPLLCLDPDCPARPYVRGQHITESARIVRELP